MVSAAEGWAVCGHGISHGTILHYSHGNWRSVPSPTDQSLSALSMVSADEGWAGGDSGTLLHYSAGQWTQTASPFPAGTSLAILSIAMVSAQEGWAVGGDYDHTGTLLHYQVGGWTLVPGVAPTHLNEVVMVSPSEGWVVGAQGTILHYAQGTWTPAPSPTRSWLSGISMASRDEGWAVGVDDKDTGAVLLHYQAGTWTDVGGPGDQSLGAVTMLTANDGWAVGGSPGHSGLIMHYHAGHWAPAPSPADDFLRSLAMISADEGWAGSSGGTILHYHAGQWTRLEQAILDARTPQAPPSTATPQAFTPAQQLVDDAVANTLSLRSYHETIEQPPSGCNNVALDHESRSRFYAKGTWNCKPIEALSLDGFTYTRDAGGKWVQASGALSDFEGFYEGMLYLLLNVSTDVRNGKDFVDSGADETMDGVQVRRVDEQSAPNGRFSLWIDPQTKHLHKLVLAVPPDAPTGTATAATAAGATPAASVERLVGTWSKHNEAITLPQP